MKTYNFGQFNSITEFSKKFNIQKKCIRFLEKELWGDKMPTSPFDPTSKVYKRGDGLYRCKNTGKNFSIISNTFMGGTKIGLPKWFGDYIRQYPIFTTVSISLDVVSFYVIIVNFYQLTYLTCYNIEKITNQREYES